MTTKHSKVIKLSKEGARALKLAPSDSRLIKVLSQFNELERVPKITVRWLIIQVLAANGYIFEIEGEEYAIQKQSARKMGAY